MTTPAHLWIQRQKADEIFEKILSKPEGLTIYIVSAGPGLGKTYLGRDLGTRLGSETGYESGHMNDIYWSGIVDLYDPDTGNSKRIEQRWIQSLPAHARLEFKEYYLQRSFYERNADKIAMPSEVEKQIDDIRNVFAEGMTKAVKTIYPVMVFDTVERLQMVLDPAQQQLHLQDIDPSDVLDWLLFQVRRLPKGIILMLGRSIALLTNELKSKVDDFNSTRKTSGLLPVKIEEISLDFLSPEEQTEFFQQRVAKYPALSSLLDPDLKNLLCKLTQGNPLLMDIALQTLLETRSPQEVRTALQSADGIKAVEGALLKVYMHLGSVERQSILTHLAIARNGLFDRLLKHLDQENYSRLFPELVSMGELPFVKVRSIAVREPGQDQPTTRWTYFLHDEMYEICDRVGIIGMAQIRSESVEIVRWYEEQIRLHSGPSGQTGDGRRPEAVRDLLVESLPYRMRSNPEEGYKWYMAQSDRAIRNSERGLDLRLRDGMSQFMGSAGPKGHTGDLPASAIDREILSSAQPRLYQDFLMDSALQWIKRYSVRGRHEKVLDIAERATWVKTVFANDRERYFAPYAELRLWLGQSNMYAGHTIEALNIYNAIIKDLGKDYAPETIKRKLGEGKITNAAATRICQIAGRVFNNRGYLYWMYFGMYWAAQEELSQALDYFDLVKLPEEKANTKDNLGRVFTILGFDFSAFETIGEGLKLRLASAGEYRQALSRISLAIAYTRFDNIPQALIEVEGALQALRGIQIERGVALALTTRGIAYRTQAELWRVLNLTATDALALVSKAEADLEEALKTFSKVVQEPIREVQAYNELACCYRTRVMLFKSKDDMDGMKDALDWAKSYFDMAIDLSEKNNLPIEKLDSLQDRAVLYNRAGQFDKAIDDLEVVRKLIPSDHKVNQDGGLLELDGTSRIDAYYKLMGQVELLSGGVIFDKARLVHDKPGKDIILETLDHYVLAVAYFFAFSGKAFTNRQTSSRIYTRLRDCSREFLVELRDRNIPEIIEKYGLPHDAVQSQFDEVFSLLIPGSKGQNWGRSSRH